MQKLKTERAGPSPVAWVQPHIYKDPPKGIFTRKKERVNEAEVMWMAQPDGPYGDPTRLGDPIQRYARGQNPMVEVMYQNAGGASRNTALGNAQVSAVYKVDTVRPPLTPLEAQQPISNPRMHQNYAVLANPSLFPQSIANDYDKSKVRLMTTQYTTPAHHLRSNFNSEITIHNERLTDKLSKSLADLINVEVTPTYSYNLDNIRDTSTKQVTETKDLLQIASVAPTSFTNIVVFDPKSNIGLNVEANIQIKNAIAVTAAASAPLEFRTNDGQLVRVKDYEYKTVQSAYGGNPQLVIYVRQPDVVLDRNTPLYAAQSMLSTTLGDDRTTAQQREAAKQLSLESVLPFVSATTSVDLNSRYNEEMLRHTYDPTKIYLERAGPEVSATASATLTNAFGYNEEQARAGKVKELDKLSNFGQYQDRASKPNFLLRGLVV